MEEGIRGDLLGSIREVFGCGEADVRTFSPLTLAYVGDAVYELVIRSVLVEQANRPANDLNRMATGYVKAEAQARMIGALAEELTEDETAVYKRGRNAKFHTKAKNASAKEYHHATGFEALIGYLYLTGQTGRMLKLVCRGIELAGLKEN